MKKSTLFFKVMVLLALLVPWTSWGQDANTLMGPSKPNWDNDKNLKGTLTLTINSGGEITEADYSQARGGIEASKSVTNNKLTLTLKDWKFDETYGNKPVTSGWNDVSKYFELSISGNGDKTLTMQKGASALTDMSKTFKVKVQKKAYGNDPSELGHIKVVFKKGTTDITNDDDFKISWDGGGKGTQEYNGKAVDVNSTEFKNMLRIEYGKKRITSYFVSVEDNKEVKNVGTYALVITPNEEGLAGSKTTTYEVTKAPLTISLKENLTATIGATRTLTNDDFSVTGLVNSETVTVSTTATVNTEKIGAVDVTISKDNVTLTGSNGFDENNYDITYNGGKVTVEKKKINASEVVVYFGDKQATAEGIAVPYDGKSHGVTKVMIGDEEITGYTVSYADEWTKESSTEAPVHVAWSNSQVYKYIATITLPADYDVTGTITAGITISRINLEVKAQDANMEMKWKNGEMVLTASEYLKLDGVVDNDKEEISLSGNLAAAGDGDGYKLTKGEATLVFEEGAQEGDYVVKWDAVTAGISVGKGDKPTTTEGEDIVIQADGEDAIWLTSEEAKEIPYNGKEYKVTKLGDEDLNKIAGEVEIVVKYNDTELTGDYEIKNAGNYEITVTYKDGEGNTHTGTQKLTITPVKLTVTVLPQSITVTDLSNESVEAATDLMTAIEESQEEGKSTVTIDGEQNGETVEFAEDSKLSLVTPADGKWIPGKNASAITAKTGNEELKLAEPFATNYELLVNPGDLTIIYEITDENQIEITFDGEGFNAEGTSKVYDGIPVTADDVKVTVNGVELTADEYDVTCGNAEFSLVDAGIYQVTVTLKGNYKGSKNANCEITPRPITLYFSFGDGDNAIAENERLVLGKNAFIEVVAEKSEKNMGFADGEHEEFEELVSKGVISAEFAMGEENSDGTWSVELVSFTYPAGEVEGYNLKYSNYDATLLTGHVKAQGEGGEATELPETDEDNDGNIDYPGEGGSGDIIVGDIDIIDEETGIGGSGINYRQYELNFCETDFLTRLNDYDAEGLKLFSRHDKKYTKAGGSFTVWYEKDGVKNAEYGDYRIYISRNGANGNYTELKLDEVSDYFQIRNVQSDIYVRIYYGTGFPVANEEITATDVRAYAQANKIVVITPEPTDVQIISMAGAVVATDQVTGQREFANLAEGVYIVRMGETVIKLQVRN